MGMNMMNTNSNKTCKEAPLCKTRLLPDLLLVANNESSEVIDILLPVTFYFNPSTRLDNEKNL